MKLRLLDCSGCWQALWSRYAPWKQGTASTGDEAGCGSEGEPHSRHHFLSYSSAEHAPILAFPIFLQPHRTLAISNVPCMPDTTPRACNVFLIPCYKTVTGGVGWDNSVKSLRGVELALQTELDMLKRSSCLELFAIIKASKTYRRWRKILKKKSRTEGSVLKEHIS